MTPQTLRAMPSILLFVRIDNSKKELSYYDVHGKSYNDVSSLQWMNDQKRCEALAGFHMAVSTNKNYILPVGVDGRFLLIERRCQLSRKILI